jgi:hypothetical protein
MNRHYDQRSVDMVEQSRRLWQYRGCVYRQLSRHSKQRCKVRFKPSGSKSLRLYWDLNLFAQDHHTGEWKCRTHTHS